MRKGIETRERLRRGVRVTRRVALVAKRGEGNDDAVKGVRPQELIIVPFGDS